MYLKFLNNSLVLDNDFRVFSGSVIREFSHFIHSNGDFQGVASGTNAIATALNSQNIPEFGKQGIGILRTGTTSTGAARFGSIGAAIGYRFIRFGTGTAFIYESGFRPVFLSSDTQGFNITNGFVSGPSSFSHGVFFEYTHSTNGGRYQCICASNGVRTTVDSGVLAVNDAYVKQRIEVDPTGTEARFYINDNLVAIIENNIPVESGREVSVNLIIRKYNGTDNQGLNVDYMELVGLT
jgi:hypothetical protein